MIPDHMYYQPPEWWREHYQQYGLRFGRWQTDTRFLIMPEPERLPRRELRTLDRALSDRRTHRKQERPISTLELVLGTAMLALVVGAIVLLCYFATALN